MDALQASMQRHPAGTAPVECPACGGLGKVLHRELADLVRKLTGGRPSAPSIPPPPLTLVH